MGSPLAPILADIVMIDLERILMKKLRKKGVLWYKSHHQDIQFTSVKEEREQFAFLDVLIKRKANSFVTTVYRKSTYTGLLTKWESFVPSQYKRSAISSIVYRGIRICSTFTLLHEEFNFIRKVSKDNGYPSNFIERQVRETLDRHMEKQKQKSSQEQIQEETQDHKKKTTAMMQKQIG
ncbi:unnamed protein product [Rotaria socialis]|uniref:Helix-turn-helix domain-containing protein n=1 Tax=Rotaria socialis TaxID=392032 RepID=A0A821SJL7_9BILA|nr:unnamed protein product [Rotaria socialis]CAF4544430.1 unnamed protein product [Rotaria socialis]CAF4657076.1 unnamed protein product [Rotaria socialis]CAF4857626.1 unnamed protein product [Rotaria socialis]